MLKLERDSLKKCKRLDFLSNILLQVPKIVNLNVTHFNKDTKYLYQNNKSVLDFSLRAGWTAIPPPPPQPQTNKLMMGNSMESS